jgi:hypothetical protein
MTVDQNPWELNKIPKPDSQMWGIHLGMFPVLSGDHGEQLCSQITTSKRFHGVHIIAIIYLITAQILEVKWLPMPIN